MNSAEVLNSFLVDAFDEILKTEENALVGQEPDLSLREIHLIDAVCRAVDQEQDNRSAAIAAKQRVTAGTLTTAVTALEKKGYLERRRDEQDKRAVRLYPTERGREAQRCHAAFHREMVAGVLDILDEGETLALVRALAGITNFFRGKQNHSVK